MGVSLGVCLSVNHLLGLVTAIYERRTCVVSNRPTYSLALLCNSPSHRMSLCLFSVSGGAKGGGGRGGGIFTGAIISSCKCISTTPIGAPIYIWPRAEIPPASPLFSVAK